MAQRYGRRDSENPNYVQPPWMQPEVQESNPTMGAIASNLFQLNHRKKTQAANWEHICKQVELHVRKECGQVVEIPPEKDEQGNPLHFVYEEAPNPFIHPLITEQHPTILIRKSCVTDGVTNTEP